MRKVGLNCLLQDKHFRKEPSGINDCVLVLWQKIQVGENVE
jgi:hypothetical protein